MPSIFLTHNIDQLDKPAVFKIFNRLMFSIEKLYTRNHLKLKGFRERINSVKQVAYDSGGFSFLLGKIKQPPDPKVTVAIYKALGFREKDFLVQLDLPPQYYMSKNERLRLIYESAKNYHIMVSELGSNVLGVVHGWDVEELKLSLELLRDPDKVALGTYFPVTKVYAHKYIGLGSFAVKTVLPEKSVELGPRKTVATPSANAEKVLQRVPKKVVYERLVTAFNLLRDYHVFCLGGSGPNTAHLIFFLGAKYIDGSSWRLAAKLWRIYVPHLGEFSVGVKRIAKRLNDKAIEVMKEYYYDSPLKDIPFHVFLGKIRQNGSEAFILRALWNAYVMKVEEQIANQYSNDPDRYYKYLCRRWENSPWKRNLEFVVKRIKQPYVQTKLTVFIKKEG